MEYRIKQVGDWYYPQVKKWGLFWVNMRSNDFMEMRYTEVGATDSAIRSVVLAAKKDKEVTIHQFKWDKNDYLD